MFIMYDMCWNYLNVTSIVWLLILIIFYVVFDFIVHFCFIFMLGKTIKCYSQYIINVKTIIATNYNGYKFPKKSNKYIDFF